MIGVRNKVIKYVKQNEKFIDTASDAIFYCQVPLDLYKSNIHPMPKW